MSVSVAVEHPDADIFLDAKQFAAATVADPRWRYIAGSETPISGSRRRFIFSNIDIGDLPISSLGRETVLLIATQERK